MNKHKGTDFALDIIYKFYEPGTPGFDSLINHSELVRDKALEIASKHPELDLDIDFIEEGAMLHDIGVFLCNAPEIYCFGKEHYMRNGVLGAALLREMGYEKHSRVCERHTGSGLEAEDIIREKLPLPHIDLLPETHEEKIICLADKYYSKSRPGKEKEMHKILKSMAKYGEGTLERFEKMCKDYL